MIFSEEFLEKIRPKGFNSKDYQEALDQVEKADFQQAEPDVGLLVGGYGMFLTEKEQMVVVDALKKVIAHDKAVKDWIEQQQANYVEKEYDGH